MRHEDRFGAWSDLLLYLAGVHVPGEGIAIYDDRNGSGANYGGSAGYDCKGWDENLFTGFEIECSYGGLQGQSTIANGDTETPTYPLSERFLKPPNKRAFCRDPA
jgi:hypothetical protein